MNWMADIIKNYIKEDDTVLSLGCGICNEIEGIKFKNFLGVDIYQPYVDELKKRNINAICRNIIDFESDDRSYDIVLLMDIVEHLEKEDAIKVIEKAQRICSKKVILYTPSKFIDNKTSSSYLGHGDVFEWLNNDPISPYKGLGINKFQEHRCVFSKKELENMGFVVNVTEIDNNFFGVYEKPKISIIIPSYNYPDLLQHCLKSIENQKTKYKYEIIVVDDGEMDLSNICKSKTIPINYIKLQNNFGARGLSKSVNTGFLESNGEIIIQLGRDIFLFEDNCIDNLCESVIENENNVSFPQRAMDDDGKFLNALNSNETSRNLNIISNNIPILINKYFGFCFCYSRKTFVDLLGYDEDYSLGIFYDDTDFMDRLLRYGSVFKEVNCKVIHMCHPRDYQSEIAMQKINKNALIYIEKSKKNHYKSENSILKNKVKKNINTSIIITTCGNIERFLKPCVESIERYTDLQDKEIIVVANGCSKEEIKSIQSITTPLRLVSFDERIGYPKANNVGIEYSNSKYIVLLNDDTVLLEQSINSWINILQKPFLENDRTGITGPVKFTWDCGGIERTSMAFWCVMFTRKLVDEIGILSEDFEEGCGEDGDFSIRSELAGYNLTQTPIDQACKFGEQISDFSFPIFHHGNGTFSNIEVKNKIIDRNNNILKNKWGNKKVEISIIVSTCNHLEDALRPCLDKVFQYTDLKNKEIIVVPNGCGEDTREYLNSLGDKIRYIWINEASGAIIPVNRGIEAAIGKYVVLLDDDSFLLPQQVDDWINILQKPFLENNQTGVTGPFIHHYKDIGNIIHSGCAMYLKKALLEVGCGDTAFGYGYFYDPDLSLRIKDHGYNLVGVPIDKPLEEQNKNGTFEIQFPIFHSASYTTMDKEKDIDLLRKNRDLLYSRHSTKNKREITMEKTNTIGRNITAYMYREIKNA